MYIRKIAAAAGFACGAALAFAPFASADLSNDAAGSAADSLIYGLSPAAVTPTPIDLDISFDGYTLYDGGGTAVANTGAAGNGFYDFAIAYGAGANATAEGGYGDYALASGTNALAHAGSMTPGATGFNFNVAEDIGNNTLGGGGAHDGAYAGGGSLIGNTDATDATGHVVASSNNAAYDFGNNGLTTGVAPTGGNSGAFAGDSGLIGYNHVAGSGDTAYTNGNLLGFGDGSAAVAGNNNFASSSGNETGMNEGAFSGFGNNNTAIADTNYTTSGDGVSATFGNGNYAYVYGPNNSTADAGGNADHLGNNNIAYVTDPYGTTGAADNASAGSTSGLTGVSGNSDLAEVLYTHGDASATGGSNLYDVLTPFGPFHSASLPAAADPAAVTAPPVDPLASTVNSEIASLNSIFVSEADLAGKGGDVVTHGANTFDTISLTDAPHVGTPTFLDYELYGLNPIANSSPDPGSYDVFNGALTEFSNAYNVELFSLLNPTAAVGTIPLTDLFGNPADIAEALATPASMGGPVVDFLTDGWNDLLGYF
jgi:hypothetical protein